MTTVRISVIIPIYNMEEHLPRCIDSVMRQSYTNLEVILINDGSLDSSGDICDDYARNDSRIRVIHKTNSGVSAARNSGLGIAKGDYISFVDPDDYIEPDTYKILAELLSSQKTDIIRFNAYRGGEILNKLPFEGLYEDEVLTKEILLPLVGAKKYGGMFIQGVLWLHLFRRCLIEEYNIRFNTSLRRNEDRLFTISVISHAQSMLFINDVLYHYELNNDSLSNGYKGGRWQQEALYIEELQKEISPLFTEAATDTQNRLNNDILLRAMLSIHHEFFTNNSNTFWFRRKQVSRILKDKQTRKAAKNVQKEKLTIKENLILFMMKYRCSLFLSIFESLILAISKSRNKNG